MGLVALALGYRTWHVAISHSQMGIDFRPLWEAATALEHGRSIYADRAFVYLPTTAVLCLPFTLLSYHAALNLELLLETVAVAVATALAVLPLRREWRFIAIAAAVAFVFKAELTRDTVFFGNASLLVAPLAVFALLSFEREEWFWGCGALALSLLIKPLLPVLIIVPLLRGRWRELAWTLGPAALAVVVLAVALPADGRILHLPSYLLNGSNLEGSHVAANVSLQGVGKRLGAVGPFFIARIVMVVLTLAALLHWMRGPRRSGDTGAIGTALVLTTMFAGSLAESHYLLVVMPCVLLVVCFRGDRRIAVVALPALALLFIPASYVGVNLTEAVQQVDDLLVGVLLYLTCLITLARPTWSSTSSPPPPAVAGPMASATPARFTDRVRSPR